MEAKNDPRIMVLSADMAAQGLDRFRKAFPRQFVNVGIAEQNAVSLASGLALCGQRVFIYGIAPFVTERCYEQIKVDIGCMTLPVTLVGVGGGIAYASDGPTHHAIQDIAVLRAIPGVSIIHPSDAAVASAAARFACTSTGPLYVRLDKGTYPSLYDKHVDLARGLSKLSSGTDVVIISTGTMVHEAFRLSSLLKLRGISAGVVDVYMIAPLNTGEITRLCREKKFVITVEEHVKAGGLGSAVASIIAETGGITRLMQFALNDNCITVSGSREDMRMQCGLDTSVMAERIAEAAGKGLVKR